jgi:NAD(P)-dependent dehydrogenase (short-subunit alcohol dehydrogenase family)
LNILLIGASGGIGSELSLMFPNDKIIRHFHTHIIEDGYRADVKSFESVRKMTEDVLSKFGHIDVLINASGISIDGFAHKIDIEKWREVVETNLFGNFNLVRAILPSMRQNKFGRIIFLSSVVSQRPVMGASAYSTSKNALIGLTRTVALENASLGITCNSVVLGYFNKGIIRVVRDIDEIVQSIPIKRLGTVVEIKNAIQFLMDTEYMTGQTLSLNGGLFME